MAAGQPVYPAPPPPVPPLVLGPLPPLGANIGDLKYIGPLFVNRFTLAGFGLPTFINLRAHIIANGSIAANLAFLNGIFMNPKGI